MMLRLSCSVRSHIGKVRQRNEDSAYADSRLVLVADGMGGHVAGEIASSAVVGSFAKLNVADTGRELLEVLGAAFEAANEHLRAMTDADAALDGMGTTLTAMLLAGTEVGIANVGDSRAYLFRDRNLAQITHDQTLVQKMVDDGVISSEKAKTHPLRSLLTQALDGSLGVEPELSIREARAGDRYLLCSDGLSGCVPQEAMASALAHPTADQVAARLIDLALAAGAPDNVTVVVADIVPDTDPRPNPPLVGGAVAAQHARPTAGQN